MPSRWWAVAVAFLGLDLAIYWQHRLFHRVPLFWRLHRVHHADTAFDVTLAVRFHPLEIALSMAIKFAVVKKVLDHYRATHEVNDVDGARVNFGDGWGLVRASNTQAVLVLRFEAATEARRDALRAEVEEVVRRAREEA